MILKRNRCAQVSFQWASQMVVVLLVLSSNAWAASSDAPVSSPAGAAAPTAPGNALPSMEKESPVVPGKYELADSAFKKLDPVGKGYVAKEDTKGLAGFEPIFNEVDSAHTGKLDYSQFVAAWKRYSADVVP